MRGRSARVLVVALTAALVVAVSTLPASADDAHGRQRGESAPLVRVGAAAVDVTPPLASSGFANPAACTGASSFHGPHLLSLEEPYTDTNGNGRHDAGEPFLDCPTPRADGTLAPPDGRWDGIYLGGGDGGDRQPTAVLDPLWARTVVVSSGHRTVALTSVDNEGVFKEIWDRVRAKVRTDLHGARGLDDMVFTSTHDESAPDTIGISGPDELTSGSDPFYVEFLIARTARSIELASSRLRPATLWFGQARPDDMTTCWSSYPFAADEELGVMQARDLRGRAIVTLVNYGIHAEELGFSSDAQDRLHLSSDWHNFARRALEARYGGVAITVAGSVGSVEMPQVYPTTRDLTPVSEYSSQGNGGCRTIYATDATRVSYGYTASTEARGERIATWAERALAHGSRSHSTVVDVRRRSFFVHLDNALFALGSSIGVINGKDAYRNGVKLSRDASGAVIGGPGDSFLTDAAWLRIGDGEFVSAPGEVFPFTFARDFSGPDDVAVAGGAPVKDWIMARMSAPWRFVVGLGDDMIGYIFPQSNAVAVPTSLTPPDDTDRFGCAHSDDGEAASASAGDLVTSQLASLIGPSTDRSSVHTGRYVWRDATLHRSPLGDGGQACAGPGNVFRPAPGGGAVAVRLDTGVTIRVDGRHWRWMDLRGRPEVAVSTQTRGVVDRQGRRVWIDVFPALT
jgi:hypothetical protein